MATCELTVTNRPFGLTARLTRSEASRRGRAARRPDRAVAGPSAFGCALPEGGAARTSTRSETLSGGHSEEATPVLIPNTAVKLLSPDGTALATAWESRTLPDSTPGATRREPVSPLFLGDHIQQWRKIRFGRLRSSSIEPFSGLSGPAGPQRPQDRPCSRARTQCAPGPSVPPPDRLPPALAGAADQSGRAGQRFSVRTATREMAAGEAEHPCRVRPPPRLRERTRHKLRVCARHDR